MFVTKKLIKKNIERSAYMHLIQPNSYLVHVQTIKPVTWGQ